LNRSFVIKAFTILPLIVAAKRVYFDQLNVIATLVARYSQNVFLESQSKAGVFCDVTLQNNVNSF